MDIQHNVQNHNSLYIDPVVARKSFLYAYHNCVQVSSLALVWLSCIVTTAGKIFYLCSIFHAFFSLFLSWSRFCSLFHTILLLGINTLMDCIPKTEWQCQCFGRELWFWAFTLTDLISRAQQNNWQVMYIKVNLWFQPLQGTFNKSFDKLTFFSSGCRCGQLLMFSSQGWLMATSGEEPTIQISSVQPLHQRWNRSLGWPHFSLSSNSSVLAYKAATVILLCLYLLYSLGMLSKI